MAIPSPVKFTRNGVEFTSNVDRVNYTIWELSRAALRDVGRYIVRSITRMAPRQRTRARLYSGKLLCTIWRPRGRWKCWKATVIMP